VAFVIDIRRGNRDLHLMYRALFELAHDRAEFVSLLFSIPRPSGSRRHRRRRHLSAFERMKGPRRRFGRISSASKPSSRRRIAGRSAPTTCGTSIDTSASTFGMTFQSIGAGRGHGQSGGAARRSRRLRCAHARPPTRGEAGAICHPRNDSRPFETCRWEPGRPTRGRLRRSRRCARSATGCARAGRLRTFAFRTSRTTCARADVAEFPRERQRLTADDRTDLISTTTLGRTVPPSVALERSRSVSSDGMPTGDDRSACRSCRKSKR
jgi:hypothetical protein